MSLTRPITRSLTRAITRALTAPGAGSSIFDPISLFAANEPGAFYDTNDLSTMFVDSNGVTPATVNGLVGLQLDKSRGLAVGSDVRASGAIGLLGTATAATYNSGTGAGSVTRVDATNQSFVTFTGLVAGGFYRLTFSAVSAALALRTGGVAGTIYSAIAASGSVLCLADASGVLTVTANAAGTATFTLASITSLAGLHRYQATTGFKPVLRGTPVGAPVFADDFSDGNTDGWVPLNGALLSVVSGAMRIQHNGSTNPAATLPIPTVVGRSYRLRMAVLSTSVVNNTQMRIGTAAAGTQLFVSASAPGARIIESYFTASTTISWLTIFYLTGTADAFADVDNIELHDVSADAVTAPYGLQFDGADDFLLTASANFTSTDAVTVCAGVRKFSDTAQGTVCELTASTAANNGSFLLAAPDAATPTFAFDSKGTVQADAVVSGNAAPITAVLTGAADISADTVSLRVNGVLGDTDTGDQGTGNYSNAIVYYGRRGGATLPYNGLAYPTLIIGRLLTTDELTDLEAYTATGTGVTI